MSLLSNLLSKIKHLEHKRDVPPGLRSTVATLQRKESQKRRLIFFSAFVAFALLSGFITVYLIEKYITGDLKQNIKQQKQVIDNRSRSDTQHYAKNLEPQNQNQQNTVQVDKTVQTPKAVSGKEITTDTQNLTQKKMILLPKPKELETKEKSEMNISHQKPPEDFLTTQDRKTNLSEDDKTHSAPSASFEKDLYLHLANNYENKKDYPNAIASYKKVLNIEPKNFRVMNNIASLFIQLNSFEDARIYAQMALSHKKDYVPALINAGIALAKLEMTEDAEKYLLRALALEQENKQVLLNIAVLYEKKYNYTKAREYYLRLERLGDVQGRVGLERIKDRQIQSEVR